MEHDHPISTQDRMHEVGLTPQVEYISVIAVEFNRGVGCCEASPVRRVFAYYDTEGQLLAERDTWSHDA